MANGHGGARPGAGRKPDPQKQEFREWLRTELGKPEARKKLLSRAWKSKNDTLLIELQRQAFGMYPQSVQLSNPEGGPIEHVFRVIQETPEKGD